jgi:IS5 family transposase
MKKEERLVHKIKCLIRRIGLPRWLHHYGPKKYEFWHHLFALVVRQFCQLSYRRVSWLLDQLGMTVPSYSALAKMSKRLPNEVWQRLLAATHNSIVNVAALDSTYFARSNPSYHYLRRIDQRGPPGIPVKANVLVETRTKKVLAVKIRILPAGDCRDVTSVLKHCKPKILVADKGYDSEAVHEHCFDQGIISMIPTRQGVHRGFYRRKMQNIFRLRTYHRREMSESKFSSIKRTLGSIVRCRRARTIRAELLTKFIASNISLRLWDFFN